MQWSESIVSDSGVVHVVERGTGSIAGTYSYSNGNRTVIFKPNTPLNTDAIFDVTVSGWRDGFGKLQESFPGVTVATNDHTPPSISLVAAPSPAVRGETVIVTALPSTDSSDINFVDFYAAKTKLYDKLRGLLNERQEKVIARMFREGIDGFKGGLSADNYISITQTSRASATRDLQDLVAKGALTKTGELRHTRYHLNISERRER